MDAPRDSDRVNSDLGRAWVAIVRLFSFLYAQKDIFGNVLVGFGYRFIFGDVLVGFVMG
jgi:hypothetical protein